MSRAWPEDVLHAVASAIDGTTGGHLHWDTQARAALDAAADPGETVDLANLGAAVQANLVQGRIEAGAPPRQVLAEMLNSFIFGVEAANAEDNRVSVHDGDLPQSRVGTTGLPGQPAKFKSGDRVYVVGGEAGAVEGEPAFDGTTWVYSVLPDDENEDQQDGVAQNRLSAADPEQNYGLG